jgi:hypothetical protein
MRETLVKSETAVLEINQTLWLAWAYQSFARQRKTD